MKCHVEITAEMLEETDGDVIAEAIRPCIRPGLLADVENGALIVSRVRGGEALVLLTLPAWVRAWRHRFGSGEAVPPIAFTLDLPADVLRKAAAA